MILWVYEIIQQILERRDCCLEQPDLNELINEGNKENENEDPMRKEKITKDNQTVHINLEDPVLQIPSSVKSLNTLSSNVLDSLLTKRAGDSKHISNKKEDHKLKFQLIISKKTLLNYLNTIYH